MNTTIKSLITILSISAVSLSATSAIAGGGNKGGGNKGRGFSIGFHGGGVGIHVGGRHSSSHLHHKHHHNHHKHHHHKHHRHYHVGYPVYGYPYVPSYGPVYEPFHCWYICQPGDSLYTVSFKEYGTSSVAAHIARFNQLPWNVSLVPGQRLMLPSVSSSGRLTQSPAPAPFVGGAPNAVATPAVNFTPSQNIAAPAPTANVTVVPSEPALPRVTDGSTLMVSGQELGTERGAARLRINGLSLPIEVLEWTTSSAKVRLPKVEITNPSKAEIELLRADGTPASKTGIELMPATDRLALEN
jgi:hypothetical protein